MKTLGLSLLLFFCSLPVLAGDEIREERVQFKAGTSGTTLKGNLRGRDTLDYVLGAKAGQHMTVELHTDNPQNYFNILPPGSSDEAIFVGSSSGNRFDGTLPDSGDYRIRVYLMRAAARRDEQASYRLSIHIGGDHHQSSAAPTGDFADGLSGGPDYWEVTGVPRGDTLNVRAGPSSHETVLDEVDNGTLLRNLGCRMSGGHRWCRVAPLGGSGASGWVAGSYLRESAYQP
ncbi:MULTISPECIES: SH3 domain-containing protein [unclassified Thiocapsa]|uniref:SH3 domain-containing protein n=1 Tax=unclassified Thiocapsa TaxID=2641286 RepID=UPI0035ADF99D